MINVNEAWKLISSKVIPLSHERVELSQSHGRILSAPLLADRDYPPFDRVAMDGYALHFESWQAGQRRYRVQAMQTAGQKPLTLEKQDECIEIMTGAALPSSSNLVIRYEDSRRDGDFVVFADNADLVPYSNVHRKGVDCPKGQSFADQRMNAPISALAASFGIRSPEVKKAAKVSIIGNGDELIGFDQEPEFFQIRASNIHALRMAIEAHGQKVLGCESIRDDKALIRAAVESALESSDILLLSGGVSAGKTDYIPEVLKDAGVEEIFHKISQRPGKPLWFGQSKSGKTVFALPGNPVSSLICLYRYVLPYMRAAEGQTDVRRPFVKLMGPRPKNRALTFFLAVRLNYGEDAVLSAEASSHNGSGDFASLAGTDGFVEIPGEAEENYDPNQSIFPFYSWVP